MAVIKIDKNIFSDKSQEKQVESGKTIEECLCDFDDPVFKKGSVEIYDCDTGETTYAEITDDDDYLNAIIIVNGENKELDYIIKENDIVSVTFYPGNGSSSTIWKNIGLAALGVALVVAGIAITAASAGTLTGAGLGFATAGASLLTGIGLGTVALSVGGFVSGQFLPQTIWDALMNNLNDGSNSSGKSLKQIPNVRNAKNETIIGNTVPFVMGTQQVAPFITGSPFYDISGDRGTTQYITVLYCAGYSLLKLTDFKLGNIYLARNHNVTSGNHNTVMHGMLRGYSDTTSDIEDKWKYNDVSLEILQKGDDYGTLYNRKIIAESVNAYVLHIYDKALSNIQYGGVELASGYRTNTVKFTQTCPYEISTELYLSSGFYRTRSESSKSSSKVVYKTMPCWVAVQYRFYLDSTEKYNSAEYYKGDATYDGGWKDFTTLNNGFISLSDYTSTSRSDENTYHDGDSLDTNYNDGWIGGKAFNLSDLEDGTGSGVTQIHLVATKTFTVQECAEIAGIVKDSSGNKYADLTTLQIRVVRLSPQYCAQESSSNSKYGTWSYCESIKWNYITSKCFDNDKLSDYYKTNGSLPLSIDDYVLRPCNADKLNNVCYIALKVKADSVGEISGELDKLSVVAESLAPKYNDTDKTWYPETVTNVKKYYGAPVYNTVLKKYEMGAEITEAQYIAYRQTGIKAIEYDAGSNMVSQMKAEIFTASPYILSDAMNTKYVTNNPASMFLLAACGTLLKRESMEYYAQNKDSSGNIAVGDINMQSCTEAYQFCEDVTDGSTYDENDDEYVSGGTNIRHMTFGCNGYIYTSTKLDDILSNICICARGVYTIDNIMRLTMVIDKPNDYSVGIINQSNCIDASNSISFEDIPSGYKMTYPNEDDGYQEDVLYAMDDGEDYTNPLREITDLSLKYVTNTYQSWSLARYVLGCAKINKEVITRTLGAAGYSVMIGDVMDVQDLNILIGTDHGGHIQSLIADDNYIYGFICDNTYEYTGEINSSGLCTQGVKILQSSQWQSSRVISIRMATTAGIIESDGTVVVPTIGTTNQVVFATKIVRDTGKPYDDSSSVITYLPEAGDIVAFGEVDEITAKYKINKITHTDKNQFQIYLVTYDESLYNYGSKLPSYNSHLNKPASIDGVTNLDFTVTQNDVEKAASNASNMASTSVNSIIISTNTGVVIRDADDTLSPSTVTFSAHLKDYNSTLSDYIGRFIIYESIDGINFIQKYESSIDETSHEYTPSSAALIIKAELYEPGGVTILHDSETVGIVSNQSGYTAWIENDTLTFSTESDGNVSTAQVETCIIHAYKGTAEKTFTVGTIASTAGLTITNDSGTLTVTALTGTSLANNGTITIPVTYTDDSFTINLTVRYTKIKPGASSKNTWLVTESRVLGRSTSGSYTPSSIKIYAKYKNALGETVEYLGRFRIKETTDGSIYTTLYTSSADESGYTYVPSEGIKSAIIELFESGGTTTLSDSESVLVLSETTGYQVWIDNQFVNWGANSDGYIRDPMSYTANVYAYYGTTAVPFKLGTITVPDGMTVTVNEGTITLTSKAGTDMAVSGSIQIPIHIYAGDTYNIGDTDYLIGDEGYYFGDYAESTSDIDIQSSISYAKILAGAAGTDGEDGYTYSISSDSSVFSKSRTGVVTPSTITANAKQTIGTNSPASYAGRFIFYTTTDGSTWISVYTSTSNESFHTYTIASDILGMKIELYKAGGTTTLVASQIYAVPFSESVSPQYLGIGVLTDTSTKSFAGANVNDSGLITPTGSNVSYIITGDSMVGYVVSTKIATIYYWNGSLWTATTDQKYISTAAAIDILNLSTGGYTVTDYTVIMNAIIKNLMVSQLKLLTGGKLYAGNGNYNNADTPLFLGYDTDGVAKFSLGNKMSFANGNATYSGALSAATGTFSGALSAASGTFAGSLSAATGTFKGTLESNSFVSGSQASGGTGYQFKPNGTSEVHGLIMWGDGVHDCTYSGRQTQRGITNYTSGRRCRVYSSDATKSVLLSGILTFFSDYHATEFEEGITGLVVSGTFWHRDDTTWTSIGNFYRMDVWAVYIDFYVDTYDSNPTIYEITNSSGVFSIKSLECNAITFILGG